MGELKSTKQKLDEMFGITDGKTVDDFLDGLNLDAQKIEDTISSIDDGVKAQMKQIDECSKGIMENPGDSVLQIKTMDDSLKQVEDLVVLAKGIFKHIYESVMASDLIDSELVQSLANLMEGIHLNIQEFISLYRDKANFVNKIKTLVFQQQQKKELMRIKHEYDMEKLKFKDGPQTIDAESTVVFDIDSIVRRLDEKKKDENAD